MGVQVTISASQIDKQRLGYQAASLTHYADTAEPSIAEGSKIEIGGALYEFTVDEAGTGWAGIGVSTWAYILLTPSGATVSWSYTEVAPAWSTSKQGWYTGDNRVVGGLYKDAGGLYTLKWLYRAGSGGIQAFKEYGDGTISFATVVTFAMQSVMTFGNKRNGGIHTNPTATGNQIFDTLSPLIPNTNNMILVTGGISTCISASYAIRTAANTINIYGMKADGTTQTFTLTDGSSTLYACSLSW